MSVLRGWTICIALLITICAAVAVGGAQTLNEEDAQTKETQARGYWVDPSSGLMWAANDNGKNVNWHQATSYCRDLRVGGYGDWRLATIDQLEELIDLKAYAPEHVGTSSILHFNMGSKVHGGLLVTGKEWSSSQNVDDRGKLIGNAWWFDFVNVRRSDDDGDIGLRDSYDKRALCVRDSAAAPSAAMRNGPLAATYADPTTGLTWATQDNGKDVNLAEAMKYCHDLRTNGYSDWRLPTIEELEGLYEPDEKNPENVHLALTGDPWSTSQVTIRLRWYLSKKSGTRVFDDPSFSRAKRAMCVHGPVAQRGGLSGARASLGGTQPSGKATQVVGYWIDAATGLTWAATDSLSGSSIYMDATSSCKRLRLAGQNDWRLATADELKGIYDPNAESPGAIPRSQWQQPEATNFHVKGDLFLTGMEWVNTGDNDDRSPSQDRLVFDFKGRQLITEKRYFVKAGALCVRGAGR
jgi:hypothetical protein